MEASHLVDVPDSRLRVAIGCLKREYVFSFGGLENVKQAIIDSFCLHLHPFRVVASFFVNGLDHASGIDRVIGRKENPALMEHLAVPRFIF